MTDIKIPREACQVQTRDMPWSAEHDRRLDPDTRELLEMATLLGPRDRVALSNIIRRASEIYDRDGEDIALAVLDQIEAILVGRHSDA